MFKTKSKRILSVILSMTMVLSTSAMLPIGAFGDDDRSDVIASSACEWSYNGSTYTDLPNGLATETGQTLFHYTFDNNVGDDVSADINNDFYVGGKWQNTAYDLYEDHVYLKDAWLYAKVNDSIRNEENNKKWKIDFSFSLASINLGADRLEHILGITSSTVNTSYNGGSSFGVSTNGKVYFNTTDFENGAIGDTGLKLRDYFYGENNENNQKPLKLSYVYDDGIIRVVINGKIKFTADVSANKEFFENINYLTIGGRSGAGSYFDLYDLKATSFNDCTIHQYDAVETPPTCSEQGFTTYTCILCGQSYVGGYVETVAHTPADAVRENSVLATETTDGSYESVVYCSVCGEEISRDTVTVEKHAHILSEPVRENEVEPDVATLTNGSYDSVVYCLVCGEEFSRTTVKVPVTGSCGTNVDYTFDSETGELIISGTGAISYYNSATEGSSSASPFCNKTKITKVVIGEGITSIGANAFYGCSGIKELTMPCSTEIQFNGNSFANCTNIEKVTLTKGNGTMPDYGYYYNSRRAYLYTPWYISHSSVKDIILEDGITNISNYAFISCTELTSIDIPNSVQSIGSYAFYGCKGLTEIEIPSGVTSINDYVFYGCSGLTSIQIPESVTSIGAFAFYECSSLTSIDIPNDVTSIGKYVFYGCTGLTEIEMPANLTSIGENAFYNCSSLTSIDIPSGVTSIENYTFYNCSSLTSLNIPSGVTTIGGSAFYNCSSLTSIEIPNGVTAINGFTFYNCSSLTSIKIPSGVTRIGQDAFNSCSSLTSVEFTGSELTNIDSAAFAGCTALTGVYITDIASWANISFYTQYANPLYYAHNLYLNGSLVENLTIPNTATTISTNAFIGCTCIKSLEIADSVTTIGNDAFNGCSGITSLEIPSGVTSIGKAAFKDCSGLTSLVIPEGISTIPADVFNGASGLKEVIMSCSAEISSNAFVGCTNIEKVTLTKGTGTMYNYKSSYGGLGAHYSYTPWYISRNSIREIILEDGITNIGNCAFDGCTGLTGLTIPQSVTTIGESAFANNKNLTSLQLPSGVTSIGNSAFYACSGLTEIEIPSGVTSIGNSVFERCSGLTEIELPSGVTSIGENAFKDCTGLTDIQMPSALTSIGKGAFYNCKLLQSIDLPSGLTYIGDYAFLNCYVLTGVEIPDGVTNIGSQAFEGCYALTSIEIPDSVESLGSYAFRYCTGLTSVALSGGMTSIAKYSFWGCTGLTDIIIPKSVTSVADSAFSNCNALSDVYYTGFEYQWNEISIAGNNKPLINATKHFEYVPPCKVHTPYEAVRENEIAPTCTEAGSYDEVVYCSVCGMELSREQKAIEALGHNYSAVVTPPTCTAQGYTTYTCTRCRESYISDYTDTLEHTPAQAVRENEIPSTCAKKGSYDEVVYCAKCSAELSRTPKTIEKIAHKPAEAVQENIVSASCSQAGSYDNVVYCSVCSAELSRQTVNNEKLPHTPVTDEAVEATCTETGLTEGSHCSVCGVIITAQQTVPALGHNYTKVVTAPTCIARGFTKYTCTNCSDSYISDYVDALGHKQSQPVRVNEIPATCTRAGSYVEVITCTVCHEELSRTTKTIEKLGHNPGEAVIENEVAATCTTDGSYDEVVYCTRCRDEISRETKTVQKLGHIPGEAVRENVVPATCTADGSYDTVKYCTVCREECSRTTTNIPALGHSYNSVTVPATCTSQGYTTYTCSRCKDSYTSDYTDMLAHTQGEAVSENVVPATCTAAGSYDEVVYCTECEAEISRTHKTIEKLAHTPGEAVSENVVLATCTAAGSYDEVVYCTECETELSREQKTTQKLSHNFVIYETVLPTCTAKGYTTYKCTLCGDTYDDNLTDMIAHKAGKAVRENQVAATCAKEGSYDEVVYCTVCSTELSRTAKSIDKLEHTIAVDEAVPATCTQTGLTEGSHCSECGAVIVAQQTTPFTEHLWDDGEIIQQATTAQEGIVKYTCTACSAVKTETIEKLAGKGKFVASNVSSKAGREVNVEIYIEENPGITSLSIDVSYPEGLTLTGVTDEKLFGSGFSKGKLDSNPIALSWYKNDLSNDDSTGLFATLTFTIDEELPAGDYPIEISFDPDNVFDNEFNNVEFDVENGNVNVYSTIPGDIFRDDEINMKDIVLLQQYINRWDVEIDTEIADVNKDGRVNMKDLVLILQYINGWDVVLQ